jgi:glucokinase
LARKASICLAVDHSEDSKTFLSMISRILQLLLVDIMEWGFRSARRGKRLAMATTATRSAAAC